MITPRRNEPCSCGSGKRYKDCHGKLGTEGPGTEALLQRALGAHQQGRVDEAERGYREVLALDANNAVATHYLGLAAWQRGDTGEAEARMRSSIAASASIPDFHNNLGLLLRDLGRGEEAIGEFHATLGADAGWIEAYSNLGLTLESLGRWDEAIAAYREALARQSQFPAARQNLARVLLARGAFAEGWNAYRWRLFAQGTSTTPPDPSARPLPATLAGRSFVLITEQGIGDALFFLRFAPELTKRGARIAFRGDARLHSMLARTGVFERGVAAEDTPAPGLEPIPIGDLPWLLGIVDAGRAPPPLALTPEPQRVSRMRAVLEAQGPPPYVALTWRAGVISTGPSHTQQKEVGIEALGAALRGHAASWISVQRLPKAGEREKLAGALGAPVFDMSGVNSDLEDMLALLSLVDSYVGVSNANTYLRAGLAKPMRALIQNPPEWRWGLEEQSPWFPATTLYRQRVDGDWNSALERLASDMGPGRM